MRYAYYPGCSLHSTAKEYDLSSLEVCRQLGIELEGMEGWLCCGATPAHALDPFLAVALPAWNLAQISQASVVMACAACFHRFKMALHTLQRDGALRRRVEKALGREFRPQTSPRVLHLLEVLGSEESLATLKARIARPLKGLKVACYYGCLLVRPPQVMALDDPDRPQIMDKILRTAGAEPVEWAFKTECCGAVFSMPRRDIVLHLTSRILQEAKEAGAEAIAVACPLCHLNLDLRQPEVERGQGVKYGLPVFYFTQLVGLALGLKARQLGLERLIVDPRPMLAHKGLLD